MNVDYSNIQNTKLNALRNEYLVKKEKNSYYSKRAFARDLKISHTLLSFIFSEKRDISDSLSKKLMLSDKISLDSREVMALGLKSKVSVEKDHKQISLKTFSLMSDWSHFAILSLTLIDNFEWCSKWIGLRLGISQSKARLAMIRLQELDLVECDDDGNYSQKGNPITVDNNMAQESAKKFHSGLLKKAKETMVFSDFNERDLSSTTFAVDSKYIPYAKEKIKTFRRELTNELEGLGTKDQVYSLCVQIFPLSKSNELQ